MAAGKRPKQSLIHLRPWRVLRAMTQRQLADATGLRVSTISSLENYHYGAQGGTVRTLAAALNCEPHQLYVVPDEIVRAMRNADERAADERAAELEAARIRALTARKRYPLAGTDAPAN